MIKTFVNDYQINPKKKYLIVYFGNFSPPHKGHYSLIERFAKYDNVKIVVYVIGDETRHGIPKSVSMDIWKIYSSLLQNNTEIKEFIGFNDMLNYKHIDVVLLVRGRESGDNVMIQKFKTYQETIIKKFRKRGTVFHFLLIDRISHISSTQLCSDLDNINFYLPNNLSTDQKKEIYNKLKSIDSLH